MFWPDAGSPLLDRKSRPSNDALRAWTPSEGVMAGSKRVAKRTHSLGKRFLSTFWPTYLVQFIGATMFVADPILKVRVIIAFWYNGLRIWAFAVVVIVFVPVMLMYIIMNVMLARCFDLEDQRERRRRRFELAAGGPPSLWRVIWMHFKMGWWSWGDALRYKCTMSKTQQMYSQLVISLAVSEHTLFATLQLCQLITRQVVKDHPSITLYEALPATVSALFNLYRGVDYFFTYARICTGGNKSEFRHVLFALGYGAAPPRLLKRIRHEKHLRCEDNLRALDRPGLFSIFLCLKESSTLETCTFVDTGIENWLSAKREETYTFKPGQMGIEYDDEGVVKKVSVDGQAHAMNIQDKSKVVKINGGTSFKISDLDVAQTSGVPYSVTFEVSKTGSKKGRELDWQACIEKMCSNRQILREVAFENVPNDAWKKSCFESARRLNIISNQATHRFEPGQMGVASDENGLVQEVSADGPAHTKRIQKGDQIVKVGTEPYSKDALARAEKSGISYKVSVKTLVYERGKRHGKTALRDAIDANDTVRCWELLQSNWTQGAHTGDRNYSRDLTLAAAYDHWGPLAAILASAPPGETGAECLQIAAFNGSTRCVALLLYWRADVNAAADNFEGSSPLLMTAIAGHGNCMDQLRAAGGDIHAKDRNGEGVLHKLAYNDFDDPVSKLVESRADVDLIANEEISNGWTPLHMCAVHYSPNTARALVCAKASLNLVSLRSRNTPLHSAARKGSAEVVRVLLEGKANTNIVGTGDIYKNRTALDVAQESNFPPIVKLIKQAQQEIGSYIEADQAPSSTANGKDELPQERV